MSEMATRLSDGQIVKIGTCESMYYCRWDQRKQIAYPYMTTGLHWRLPLPEEDGIKPGDFENYRILQWSDTCQETFIPCDAMVRVDAIDEESKAGLIGSAGTVQMSVGALGLLANVKCYHGLKLNDSNEGVKFFWNGKRDALYFDGVWNKEKELMVGMACAACGKSWSMSYQDAEPLFRSLRMKLRLLRECVEYWYEHNDGRCPYKAHAKDRTGRGLTIASMAEDCYVVQADGKEVYCGRWEPSLRNFVNLLPGSDDRKDSDSNEYWRNEEWNVLCIYGEELKEIYLKTEE